MDYVETFLITVNFKSSEQWPGTTNNYELSNVSMQMESKKANGSQIYWPNWYNQLVEALRLKKVCNRAVTYQPALLQASLTRLSYGQGWQLQMPELAKREITFMVGP